MKTSYFQTILLSAALLSVSSCGSKNPDGISNYTAGSESDTLHTSGGLMKSNRGQEVYVQRCVACHGQNGDTKQMNAANLKVSVLDSAETVRVIRTGRNQMPLFSSDAVPDSDLAQLELYVKTLRK